MVFECLYLLLGNEGTVQAGWDQLVLDTRKVDDSFHSR